MRGLHANRPNNLEQAGDHKKQPRQVWCERHKHSVPLEIDWVWTTANASNGSLTDEAKRRDAVWRARENVRARGRRRRVRLSERLGSFFFESTQHRINACLVPRALCLEPFQYVRIN